MTMLHISTQKLIEKLLERTQNGTIDWKERVPDGVILETEGYVVELIREPLNVRLSQTNGRVLEDVSHDDLKAAQNAEGRNFADIVTELTREADRFARGTEQAIASILDAVESSTKPVLKSKPVFLGQPKEETPKSAPVPGPNTDTAIIEDTASTQVGSVSQTYNIDPYTKEGMSAAVGKMVAEINGAPAGDELDTLSTEEDAEQAETSKAPDTDQDASTPVAATEETPTGAVSTDITPDEAIEIEDDQEDEIIPEFKTHVVESRPAVPVTPSMTTTLSEPETPSIDAEAPLQAPGIDAELPELEDSAGLPNLPDMPDLGELETSLPASEIELPKADISDTEVQEPSLPEEEETIAPPPPLTMETELPDLPEDILIDDLPEDLDAPTPLPEATSEPVAEHAETIAEPALAEPEPAPQPAAEKPALGFSFRNKVTATGFTIGGNIGTLISGVPDDVRQRADDHERMVRVQREKAEAEERAQKAKKAADDAANARKSSIGFKSWS
ncbi:hypothetical protein [Hirschia litorea]|uniref:Uncharacterized protein n=1 Tax=Hirschia litorea TaxID=1199156 RepID=A0ABW2IJS0_9PROT